MAAIPAERLTGTGGLGVIAILGYMIPTISLLLGDQNMMQRFASAKSAEEAKKSNLGLFAAEITVCVLIILMCTCLLYTSFDEAFMDTFDRKFNITQEFIEGRCV